MPWTIVKISGGYKVKNMDTGKTYSKRPMSRDDAIAQKMILERAKKKE